MLVPLLPSSPSSPSLPHRIVAGLSRQHMLPTHVIRMPSSSSSQHDHGQEETSTLAYPPAPSQRGSVHQHEVGTSSSIWQRVLGKRGIVGLTVDVAAPLSTSKPRHTRNGSAATTTSPTPSPPSSPPAPRWSTPEFYLYYLVFLIALPLMIWVPIRLSQPSNPNYVRFATHLRQGWLFGRLRDDSDFQYRSFRDYVPALLGIMALYLGVGKVVGALPEMSRIGRGGYRSLSQPAATQSGRRNRLPFLCGFTTLFVVALHGSNSIKLLGILLANYALARLLAGRRYLAPACLWAFNVSILAAVHWNDGFLWRRVAGEAYGWLDEAPYVGLLPRWQINFNITMLRLVSYGLDRHWAALAPPSAATTPPVEQPGQTDNRARSSQPRQRGEYDSLPLYLAYILYPPLFIAGPIMSFNDFASQLSRPAVVPRANVLRYAVRFGVCMLTMEFIL